MKVSNESTPSCRRIVWVAYTKFCTLLIPDCFLIHCGGLHTRARRNAWREKFALFWTYIFIAALFCFWLEYISTLFCDPPKTYRYSEVRSNETTLATANGKIVNWKKYGNSSAMTTFVNSNLRQDISPSFPQFMKLYRPFGVTDYYENTLQVCINGFNRSLQASNWLEYRIEHDSGYLYQDGKLVSCPIPGHRNQTGADCFYTQSDFQEFDKYGTKGDLEFDPETIYNNFSVLPYPGNAGQAFVILDGVALDVTGYLEGVTNVVRVAKGAYSRAIATERMFLPLDLTILLFTNIGKDITEDFYQQIAYPDQMRDCMYTLFFHGVIPTEKYDGCDRINPALWATMGAFLLYFLFKINLANLSRVPFVQRFLFKSTPDYTPLSRWPHTLLFIPCYSESSEAIRQTLDSLARTSYPDDRKLLVFVCDGVVKSATDSKENYKSVLDALGYSSTKDPDPRPYVSLGMKSRRVNYAKVYAGFYESGRNRVPFLLIVKVGSPKETMSGRSPGNRGKRDSMVIVLSFLERCMNLAHNRITPLEFELFNQCYNLLGIDPRLLKYMLVTDADTQVQADVIHKMIARLEQDPKMLAINGYVRPANPEENIITMLQIFPNYLTFYSGLAYEACVSSVTTLNGGFVMYRLWSDAKPSVIRSQKHKSHDNIKLQNIQDNHQKWLKVSDEVVSEAEDDSGQKYTTTLSFLPNPTIRPICIHPTVLRGFATPQPNTLHMENVLLLGEEQYFGIVLLKSHPQHRLGFEPEAVAYATLPTNYFALQALQIRNIRATFHTQIEFQHIAKHLGVMYWFVSITKVVDMVLAMPIIANLYGIFIRYFIYKNLAYGIISACFTALVVLHMFYFIIRRQFKYIIWFSLYCLFSVPLFTVFFPILAAWCSDYSNRWYDVWPTSNGYRGRIHGIIDNSNNDITDIVDRDEDQVVRMRLFDFEIVEAEKQAQREKEQAAMLDAKFNGFGNYVSSTGEHQSKPSVSLSERGLVIPPAAQLKEINYYTNKKPILDEDNPLPRSSSNNPFTSALDDPFDDIPPTRRHKQTQSQSSFFSRSSFNSDPIQGGDSTFRSSMFSSSGGFPTTTSSHARSHSTSSSIIHPSNTYFENDLRYSSSPTHSLTNSIISLERDGESQDHTTGGGPIHILTNNGNKINRYHQTTNYRLDETTQGRNAPIHSRITRPSS